MDETEASGPMGLRARRGRVATACAVGVLLLLHTPQGPAAAEEQAPPGAEEPSVAAEGAVVEPTEVTTRPEDWVGGRATDRAEREDTLRLLDEAVVGLGSYRSGYYDTGDAFEVRVVSPTPEDAALVEAVQAQTSIPLPLVDVPLSSSWLESTALRLSDDLGESTAIVGVDLEVGQLYAAPQGDATADGARDSFAARVRDLVATYLPGGVRQGAVAEDATAEEAVTTTVAEVQPVNAWAERPVRSGRWVDVQGGADAPFCTAGFLVKSNDADVFRFTTAGHCFEGGFDPTPPVKMANGANVGTMTSYRPGGWDIANFSIPSDSIVADPSVTVSSAGHYRRVQSAGNPANGSQYCFTGRGIVADGFAEKCGEQNKTVISDGKQLYCLERRTFDGDSGGPVYYVDGNGYALARGTMVLAAESGFPTNHHACYNRIGDVAAAGDWSVVLWK